MVVDANGAEAQTLSNVYLALEQDAGSPRRQQDGPPQCRCGRRPRADRRGVGLDIDHALPVSAKTGLGVDAVLEPSSSTSRRLRATGRPAQGPHRDSGRSYVGAAVLLRVVDGDSAKATRSLSWAGARYDVTKVYVCPTSKTTEFRCKRA